MSDLNDECANCGHRFAEHKLASNNCPLHNIEGELIGWALNFFTTELRQDPKLYTSADLRAAKLETVDEIKSRIQTDKETFERAGMNTKGHFRAIMLIDEMKEEINAS